MENEISNESEEGEGGEENKEGEDIDFTLKTPDLHIPHLDLSYIRQNISVSGNQNIIVKPIYWLILFYLLRK